MMKFIYILLALSLLSPTSQSATLGEQWLDDLGDPAAAPGKGRLYEDKKYQDQLEEWQEARHRRLMERNQLEALTPEAKAPTRQQEELREKLERIADTQQRRVDQDRLTRTAINQKLTAYRKARNKRLTGQEPRDLTPAAPGNSPAATQRTKPPKNFPRPPASKPQAGCS
jgi:hypothetical protein